MTVPTAIVGVAGVAGSLVNAEKIVTTPINQKSGGREGKDFTPAGKREMDARSGGKCEGCGGDTRQVQNQKGQPTPPDQRQRHHVKPKSQGGSGTPDNGKVLCASCHKEAHRKLRG